MNTPGVGGVVLHPHPVAEDRAAGERRRRVDGQHGHLDVLEPRRWPIERARQRRLAGAGRAGEPDRVGRRRRSGYASRPTVAGLVAAALDQRQQAGQRRPIAGARGVEQLRRVAASARSLTRCHGDVTRVTTSVTPSTRSRMIRSMPAFSVCVDAGQVPHAPTSSTRDDAGRLVDVAQHDVAAVGLQGRADDLDGLFDLCAHAHPIQPATPVRSMP